MPEINYDWSKFTHRININSDVQTIYDHWTSGEKLEQWFLRKALICDKDDVAKQAKDHIIEGDKYKWYWHGYSDAENEAGEFFKANGNDTIRFNFGLAGTVSVNIQDKGDYRIVELTQANIPITEEGKVKYHLGCTKGWLFYLTNLKSILEGGIDLRNKDMNIKGVVTA